MAVASEGTSMSASKFIPTRRTLSLFRRLQLGPASRKALMGYAESEVDPDFYSGVDASKAKDRLEKDLGRLRGLGIEYEYDRKNDEYRLLDIAGFSPLSFTDEEMQALALLAETFKSDAPGEPQVQHLVRRIVAFLPPTQQNAFLRQRRQLIIDLQQRDGNTAHEEVMEKIQGALDTGRLLRFDYLSPSQKDGISRTHTVEPWQLVFDSARGHIYLDAFWLQSEGPHGVWKPNRWQQFKPNRILRDTVAVLPEKRGPTPPKRPSYHLEYLLSPEIARWGQVTRHFADMESYPADDRGWVRVTATTDDLFRSVRFLLTYGANCKVVGGPEARKEMERLVTGMAAVYGIG